MKSKSNFPSACHLAFLTTALLSAGDVFGQTQSVNPLSRNGATPMHQFGALAGKQYSEEGLSVTATPAGAQLRCAFQRLEGGVTSEGLWLSSTADGSSGRRFHVRAIAVGRADGLGAWPAFPPQSYEFPCSGTVDVNGRNVRFYRPGLIEEYSVSIDGVRQDFIVQQRPFGNGELRLDIEVTGAKSERLNNGVRLTLGGCGRRLIYDRLSVSDAQGRELAAYFEVTGYGLAVMVDDGEAVYPVRIDPTFSDANWISMGGYYGANETVVASTVDESGNLYIGGGFSSVSSVLANRVAKWDGISWSSLGSGINNGGVTALAVSGNTLYAGGSFTNAGGVPANRIAKWDGKDPP